MPIYLPFLQGAAQALIEALQIHDAQAEIDDASRDAYALSKCIDLSHLAADRVLKHAIAKHDPYLLLSSPKPDLLRNIRGAIMHRGAPSMFATGVRIETLDATTLAEKVLREVVYPNLDETEYAGFLSALKAIVPLRNLVQHGELAGEGDELLASIRSLLGEVYSLARIVSPEIDPLIRALDVQAEARLLAHKRALDAAWNVFVQHLREHGSTEVTYGLDVFVPKEGEPGQLAIGSDGGGNRLYLGAEVPWGDLAGLFHLRQVGGLGRALQRAVLTGFPTDEPDEITFGSKPTAARLSIREALMSRTPRKQLYPLQSGSIRIESALARLHVRLSSVIGQTRRSSLSTPVLLRDWTFDLYEDQTEGSVIGSLVSTREGRAEEVVDARGSIYLESEYVYPEDTESTLFPPATVSFRLYGSLILTLSNQSGT